MIIDDIAINTPVNHTMYAWEITEPGIIKLKGKSIYIKHLPELALSYLVSWGDVRIFAGSHFTLNEAKKFVTEELIPRLIEMGQEP